MGRVKKWLAVVGIAVVLACGAVVVLARGSSGGQKSSNHPALPAHTNLKQLSPADVTQMVQGLLAQAQQANAAGGSKGLTQAQASAIINEQLKQLGVPALNNK
ncbi:MAG TPA: hypothetical protein VHT30_02740 [Acidimicrobiales bacterium]|jgi:preprotein translocase subunit SecF|nr:hypothetical protein [Acidimicrobiales bacterium]